MSLDLTLLRSVQLCKHICGLCVSLWFVILIPCIVEAQRRGVSLTGTVTEIVALTIAPNSSHSDIDLNTVSTGSSVRLTLSGAGVKSPVIRVRLLVRSNTGFNISGILESNTVLLTQLWVIDVRATGKLVSREAIESLEIPQDFDMRGRKDTEASKGSSNSSKKSSIFDVTHPFLLLSGPRVSLGGTLESPNNALQITVLIRLKPQSTGDWRVHLTFLNNKQGPKS